MEISSSVSFAIMATSMIMCFLLNILIDKLPVPPKYADRSRRHKWKNVVISTIHAVSASTGGLASIYFSPELLSDHLNATSAIILISMAVTNGYYMYDFIDLAMNTKLASFLPLMIHHILDIFIIFWVIVEKKMFGIVAITSCIEINGISLHLRHILLMFDYKKDDLVFKINNVFNVITYVVLRLGILAYDTWWLFANWTEVNFLFPPMGLILLLLNIGLFYRLIESDYIRKPIAQKSKVRDIMAD
ncbi:TLC domain-containing protein 2-like [Lytechinus pictus]|uniref:TLC domain-containing protein 2-like n=1 Tax=Lytechinus pictus TaxID=7653 RepID=UPI0030B9C7A3